MPVNLTDGTYSSEVQHFLDTRKGGERLILLLSAPTLAFGLAYWLAERAYHGAAADATFVVLLSLATVFLSASTYYLRRSLVGSAAVIYEGASKTRGMPRSRGWLAVWLYGATGPGQLLEHIFDRRAMALTGTSYGILLGSVPFQFGVHTDNVVLQLALGGFMFAANFVTGAAIYSVGTFLRQCWHLADTLDITCNYSPRVR